MRKRWRALRIAVFVASTLFALARAEAKILAQWVQIGADGSSSVRAISDDACPVVTFDGVALTSSARSMIVMNGYGYGQVEDLLDSVHASPCTPPRYVL